MVNYKKHYTPYFHEAADIRKYFRKEGRFRRDHRIVAGQLCGNFRPALDALNSTIRQKRKNRAAAAAIIQTGWRNSRKYKTLRVKQANDRMAKLAKEMKNKNIHLKAPLRNLIRQFV